MVSSEITELKKRIVEAAYQAGEGHIPSAFSILDIVWILYDRILQSEDRFVLSKGHGCLALYAVLERKGLIPSYSLCTFAGHDSILGGHPDRNKVRGVVASTGSLGHGLPMAVGIAMAKKKIKAEPGRVFCLVGDGEMNEGSTWEACLLAAHHNLDNLIVIVDNNLSSARALSLGDLERKFQAFDFSTYGAAGHSEDDLYDAFHSAVPGPIAVVAYTTKGNGCARMADPFWHHRAPSTISECTEILKELECENN